MSAPLGMSGQCGPRSSRAAPDRIRIVVAMSGGVDSAVAACLLAEAGHDVVGLSMQLYDQRQGDVRFGSCCTLDDLHDARRTASAIGIPHYIVNFERQFDDHVVSNFVREYASGRTPIPCVRCNSDLKFAALVRRASALDATCVATGHYARVQADPVSGLWQLKRGADPERDQSYFLFSLTQAQLEHARFPIGDLRKEAVRAYAHERRLPVADKPDSREICFVADGDYATFVEGRNPSVRTDGVIRNSEGHVLGRHHGIHRFTVGQRKGLGLSSALPLYVLEIQPDTGSVVVGPRDALERTSLNATDVNWIAGAPPARPVRVTARIRHRHREAAAVVTSLPDAGAVVEFDRPQAAVAPGQAVVFYDGDTVLGGGWIDGLAAT